MINKIYWDVKNILEAKKQKKAQSKHRVALGCLSHKKDLRDVEFLGGGVAKGKQEKLSHDTGIRFNQEYLNICVFASRVQGFSMQEGIRFSTRWDVKLGRKLGMITGDGFSYLRAENEIGLKYGRLPYKYMPDELNGMSFNEYSKWTSEDDKLLEIARKYRTTGYKQIKTKAQAIEALEAGYTLFTAGKWYEAMNRPQKPYFLLKAQGGYIGGHAYGSTGYRNWGDDFENPQTFGKNYGDNGVAWIDDLFAPTQFPIYIEEFLPFSVKYDYFLETYEGKFVKGSEPEIFEIKGGKKRHITEEEFKTNPVNFEIVSDSYLLATPNL